MEQQPNTSFIPKKSLQANVSGKSSSEYVQRRTVHGPGFFLSVLIFIAALVTSAGVFGYTKIIERSIDDKIKEIERVQEAYQPKLISELIRVDKRLLSGQKLLGNHVVVTELFDLLETITLTKVRYVQLNYDYSSSQQNTNPTITLVGESNAFIPIALQKDQYQKDLGLLSPMITTLSLQEEMTEDETENKKAVFGATMKLDPLLVSYTAAISSGRRDVLQQQNTPEEPVPTEEPVEQVVPEAATTTIQTVSTSTEPLNTMATSGAPNLKVIE